MTEPEATEITRYLQGMQRGDSESMRRLLPYVYDDLRKLAENVFTNRKVGKTLQPTALVHEAYVRLVRHAF